MKQLMNRIVENKEIAEGFYRMRIESSYLGRNMKPGQFVEVRCSEETDPLLRRPLGCHRILKDGIELLYEVVGKGTEILSGRKSGERLDLIGPLGNGFAASAKAAILVAGGIGIAPLVALAEEFARRDRKISAVIGAKKRSHILCERELKGLGCVVKIATEDGSKGTRGLATELLEDMLATSHEARATIYACGPVAMLKEIGRIASEKAMPCQVSLEERMACGVGVCLGCPVKVRTQYPAVGSAFDGTPPSTKCGRRGAIRNTQYEYKMICKDGPVFDAEEIVW